MPLTPEQQKELKHQLLKQVQHLPPSQKQEFEQKIAEMSPEALELMLQEQKQQQKPQKPVFRAIIDGDIPSTKIDENKHAIAVLDISPCSKAHTLIIPKKPIKDPKLLQPQIFSLAKKIAKRITQTYKPSAINLATELKFNESILNVLPSYDTPISLSSPRTQITPEELEKIAKPLKPIKKLPRINLTKKKASTTIRLPRRIP